MYNSKILLLTLFISLRIYNLCQAEIIRGTNIPKLNVTGILGKWYLLASTRYDDQFLCTTSIIEQQSDDGFNMRHSFYPRVQLKNKSMYIPKSAVFFVTFEYETNIIVGKDDAGSEEVAMVMFDVDYDSYFVIYAVDSISEIAEGTDGQVFIYGRERALLPDEIIQNIKQSKFYQEGVNPEYELLHVNATSCD